MLEQHGHSRDREVLTLVGAVPPRVTSSVTVVDMLSDMATPVSIDLAAPDATALRKPIRGQGGFQSLLRKLQRQWDGRQLELSTADLERLKRYAAAYGGGGFQRRVTHVCHSATR